jgi:hypothetical protein
VRDTKVEAETTEMGMDGQTVKPLEEPAPDSAWVWALLQKKTKSEKVEAETEVEATSVEAKAEAEGAKAKVVEEPVEEVKGVACPPTRVETTEMDTGDDVEMAKADTARVEVATAGAAKEEVAVANGLKEHPAKKARQSVDWNEIVLQAQASLTARQGPPRPRDDFSHFHPMARKFHSFVRPVLATKLLPHQESRSPEGFSCLMGVLQGERR